MRRRAFTTLLGGAALTMVLSAALASDELAIEGSYLRNRACRGDSSDPAALRVTITKQEISYAGGTCTIDDMQRDGSKLSLQVTCKFSSGNVMSDAIFFTVRDDKTIGMAQKNGSYTATLNRCPG